MQQDIQITSTEENSLKTLQVGDNVRGVVSKLVREIAFVSLSESQEAYINLAEFRSEDGSLNIELGDEIEAQVVHVQRGIQLSRKPFEQEEDIKKLQQAIADQTVFEGLIVRTKGNGYELRLNNMRAFCSFNEFSHRKDKRPQRHIGQTFAFPLATSTTKAFL